MIAVGAVPQLLFPVIGYLWTTRRLNRLRVAVPSTRQFGVVVGIVGAFVVQLVFGYLFERTDNLVVPILSHSLLNVVFTTLTIAPGV